MSKRSRVAIMLDLDWPYKRHTALFAGTQQYAQENNWESIIDEFADDTLKDSSAGSCPYDGIIARAPKRLAEQAARQGIPLVNVWQSSPASKLLPGVFPDFAAAGRLRAEHLLARGFRNFASLASYTSRGQEIEATEFYRVIKAAGFECATAKVPLRVSETVASWRRTERAIAEWMDAWQLPIGAYIGSERTGRSVVQMCHERGLRVPEDVAITAGWNELALCENPRPSLTSVELGYERIGYEAAKLLDRLISNGNRKSPNKRTRRAESEGALEQILLPPQALVVRESTDFFAVDDPLIAAALEFIAGHSHRTINPAAVAEAVRTELRTLQRRFRKVLDRPIATEIRRVRLERAKRELSQTDRSITSISHDVGFGEPMRMYEVFQRELGVTP